MKPIKKLILSNLDISPSKKQPLTTKQANRNKIDISFFIVV